MCGWHKTWAQAVKNVPQFFLFYIGFRVFISTTNGHNLQTSTDCTDIIFPGVKEHRYDVTLCTVLFLSLWYVSDIAVWSSSDTR